MLRCTVSASERYRPRREDRPEMRRRTRPCIARTSPQFETRRGRSGFVPLEAVSCARFMTSSWRYRAVSAARAACSTTANPRAASVLYASNLCHSKARAASNLLATAVSRVATALSSFSRSVAKARCAPKALVDFFCAHARRAPVVASQAGVAAWCCSPRTTQ